MKYTRGTARMRGLAAELKALRTEAGLNTRDAAARAGLSASTLNRIELGNRGIQVVDMVALLVVYGVTGVERERLLTMAREASQPGWWETSGARLPKELPALITFESEAARIVEVSLLRIPGLLQVPSYIREILTSAGVTGSHREAMVSARLGRQAILTRPTPPRYLAIIDEAALCRPVGGGRVMAEQLRHVIDQVSLPNVDVRVIPFDRGSHTGLDGTYVTLDFTRARSIVYLEHKRSSLFVDEPEDVAPFHEATDILMETALDSSESVKFLARMAAEYDRG
ncbi:helix-turn-helix transcriptional regulator [Kibdelosporangium persicum]|uniref:Transcriptional regulator n=1 Tax=Kibdelosporangium persicum TaxID=2698649 RepID=A0ABX2FFX4_9PSEU|nr:helix-turn-helix transcriptional regulator [Kibdelosporangium persicum]NRN70311.1 Transcriptional regulator [Kibdelosporangium persicum]